MSFEFRSYQLHRRSYLTGCQEIEEEETEQQQPVREGIRVLS
jgi:hypothetical protein